MRIVLCAAAALLTACASPAPYTAREAEAAIYRGDYTAAREMAHGAIRNNGDKARAWYVLGVVHAKTGEIAQAVDAMNTAARYGSYEARAVLVKANKPVPAADLQYANNPDPIPRQSSPEAGALLVLLGAAVQGYAQGAAQAPGVLPLKTDCTSQERFGGKVETTCRTK